MYDVKIKSKRIRLTPRTERDSYSEVVCESDNEFYNISISYLHANDIYLDTGYCLNTMYIHDMYIRLYDDVDYGYIKLYIDPERYYIVLDYDENSRTLKCTIKDKSIKEEDK